MKISNNISNIQNSTTDNTIQECYKKAIAYVMLFACGKRKYNDLEIELILTGNGRITFPDVDVENTDARLLSDILERIKNSPMTPVILSNYFFSKYTKRSVLTQRCI